MTKRWYEDLPAEFEECSYDCGRPRKHTLRWPGCSQAARPEPTLGFWHTFTASDGDPAIGRAEIPLDALLPWVAYLTVDQRWEMLEEAADAEDPAACIQRWWATTLPAQREALDRAESEYWEAFRRHAGERVKGG